MREYEWEQSLRRSLDLAPLLVSSEADHCRRARQDHCLCGTRTVHARATEATHIKHLITPFLLVDFFMLSFTCAARQCDCTRFLIERKCTTLSNGYLGSRNDEERSEMRYVMRIAEFSESSNL